MPPPSEPANEYPWLDWSKELHALAQNGITFAQNPFDLVRYRRIREIAAEMMAKGSLTPVKRVLDLFSGDVGYATPKVDTRGVVFRDDGILLVKELSDGRWTLPGGWADPLESPAEAVVREVKEESGFDTRAVKLLAVYDRSRHPHEPPMPYHVYKLFIRCDLLGGAPAGSIETGAAQFFPKDRIPELSVTRITAGQISRMFEHLGNPGLPADFD
jgi:ADP-ribose pyrophosphatase YjhB (NUDIX family)